MVKCPREVDSVARHGMLFSEGIWVERGRIYSVCYPGPAMAAKVTFLGGATGNVSRVLCNLLLPSPDLYHDSRHIFDPSHPTLSHRTAGSLRIATA
jgi:hypothetical protein